MNGCTYAQGGLKSSAQVTYQSEDSTPTSLVLSATASLSLPGPSGTPGATETSHPGATHTVIATSERYLIPALPAPGDLFSFDFLYLSESGLVHWDSLSGSQNVILFSAGTIDQLDEGTAGKIGTGIPLLYAVDQYAHHIVVVRSKGVTANGSALYDLVLIRYPAPIVETIINQTNRIAWLDVSPDGEWVSYRVESSGQIMLVRLVTPFEDQLELCAVDREGVCSTPIWSQDSRWISWGDADGLWVKNTGRMQTDNLVLPAVVQVLDQEGGNTDLIVNYTPVAWSPQGRYLLLVVSPIQSSVSWIAVADTRRGKLVQVPGTYGVDGPSGSASWLNDGNLVLCQYASNAREDFINITRWQILPANENILSGQFTTRQIVEKTPGFGSGADCEEVAPIKERWLGLRLAAEDRPASQQIYLYDMEYNLIQSVIEAPIDTEIQYWAPDASGVFLMGSRGSSLFGRFQDRTYYDLRTILGPESCCYSWIPSYGH